MPLPWLSILGSCITVFGNQTAGITWRHVSDTKYNPNYMSTRQKLVHPDGSLFELFGRSAHIPFVCSINDLYCREKGIFNLPIMNLAQYQIDAMRQYGDSTALVDSKTNKTYSYSDVIERIQSLAAGLRDLIGLHPGDVVCHLASNHIDFPILIYAVNLVGGVLQTASPDYTDDDLERRFKECNTRILFASPDQAKRVSQMMHFKKLRSVSVSKPNLLSTIVTFGEVTGFLSYASLFEKNNNNNRKLLEPVQIDPDTFPAFLLSSSGTTGLPKHVTLTHTNVMSAIPLYREVYGHSPGMCAVLCLPMYHHYGILSSLAIGLNSGTKFVVMERYVFTEYLDLIQRHRAEILFLVPPIAARLVKDQRTRDYDLSSVTFIKSAAAPLGIELESQLLNLFPNTPFLSQVYGLTETGIISGNKRSAFKPGSNGKVPAGIAVKVTDPVTGSNLAPNKTGEVLVKGPQVTIGYFNNEKATLGAFDKDGYFKTGDLGYFDEEGFLFIVDRLKELIKYKGLQVAPAFLEDLLMKHPGVADAAVIGVPDDEAGELPKAFVVKQPGMRLTEGSLIDYVREHSAAHERLRGGVEFVAKIPKSASGKILRRLLRGSRPAVKL